MTGAFVTGEPVRLDLGAGDWIEVKAMLSFGERQRLLGSLLRASVGEAGGTPSVAVDMAEAAIAKVAAWLVDWNLKDDDGRAVPLSRAAIEHLDPAVADAITALIDAHAAAVERGKAPASPNGAA